MSDLITLERARRHVFDFQRGPASEALVAPGCTGDIVQRYAGRLERKPWHYQITAAIPHIGRPETLPVLIELLRLQTEPTYVLVIDTGSPVELHGQLEALRAPDVEIHYLRSHAYQHSSGPVSAAMDVAFALCRTPFLYCTHNDVFPMRRDWLAWLLDRCGPASPVIGYQQSPRVGTTSWEGSVSHTATLLHMPTMRSSNVQWNFEHYWQQLGYQPPQHDGYPDTEQPFNQCLRRAGIKPTLLGPEDNFRRMCDRNIDHARSASGLKLYATATPLERQAQLALQAALAAARTRIASWQEEIDHANL